MDFFGQMDRLWKPENGLTKYLGKVRVIYADGTKSSEMHLFVNRASFLQEVELGFDDNQGSLTFFLFKTKGESVPKHIVQLHSEQSRQGKTVSTYATTVQLHCHVHEWPERQAALSSAAQVQYTETQRKQLDSEFYRPHCMAQYSDVYKSRLKEPVYNPRPDLTLDKLPRKTLWEHVLTFFQI